MKKINIFAKIYFTNCMNIVIPKLFKKSTKRLPTRGITINAFTEGTYLLHIACMFAIAFGVAPKPNPHIPADITAAS